MWRASLPLILGGSASTLMTFVDGLFVAAYSVEAFNALVLAVPLVGTVTAVGSGVAVAAAESFAASRARGARQRAVLVSLILAVLASTIVVWAALAFAPEIARLAGLTAAGALALEYAFFRQYWVWVTPSFPALVALTLLVQLLVSLGRTGAANRIVLGAAAANVVGDAVLVGALGLGVVGAAVATDLALAGAALAAAAVLRRDLTLPRRVRASALARPLGRQALSAAMIFCAMGIFVAGDVMFGRLAAAHSPAAVTLLGIAAQMKSVFLIPTRGVCAAYVAVFGATLAARRAGRYFADYWGATSLVAAFYAAGAVVLFAFAGPLTRLYGDLHAGLLADAVFFLRIAAMSLLVLILGRVAQVGFVALGHPYGAAVQSTLMVGLAYAGAAVMLARDGVRGLAVGQLAGSTLASALVVLWFVTLLGRRRARDAGVAEASAPALARPVLDARAT
jgi:Na+-driven multidrug efflux pump